MIIWNNELYHSWGNKPKQKAREKQYNAWYYKKFKWRWLDNLNKVGGKIHRLVKKERDTKKRFMNEAEENLNKKLQRDLVTPSSPPKPKPKKASKPVTKEESKKTKSKSKSKGKGKSSGGGGGKRKSSGKGGGKSGSSKSKQKHERTTKRKGKKLNLMKSSSEKIVRVYGANGKLLDVRSTEPNTKVLRPYGRKHFNKKVRSIRKKHKRKGKRVLKKVLNKHRRS